MTPNDPRIRDQCADLAWQLHRFDVAIQHYRKAVTLDPRRIGSWIGLTRALLVTGPIKEAHQALSQAHRLAPNDPRVKRLMELIQQNKRSFHSINPQDSRD